MTDSEIIHELKLRWVDKDELQAMLGVNNERAARAWIENLNLKLKEEYSCVLSTARKKGYHIPSAYLQEDIDMANAVEAELKAKAISVFERRQSIEGFLKYAASVQSDTSLQLTLF